MFQTVAEITEFGTYYELPKVFRIMPVSKDDGSPFLPYTTHLASNNIEDMSIGYALNYLMYTFILKPGSSNYTLTLIDKSIYWQGLVIEVPVPCRIVCEGELNLDEEFVGTYNINIYDTFKLGDDYQHSGTSNAIYIQSLNGQKLTTEEPTMYDAVYEVIGNSTTEIGLIFKDTYFIYYVLNSSPNGQITVSINAQ